MFEMLSTTIIGLKRRKQDVEKLQDSLYNLIRTLTLCYPPNDEFNQVFTRDMFLKNNKKAFQRVVYYLLEVLDPVALEEKVPTWPLYEPRDEVQFRKEVMQYINELNTTYKNANIPTLMTSQLISPGGIKFIKFMLKLAQFVAVELFKFEEETSFVVATNDNNNVVTNKTVVVNRKIGEMIREHDDHIAKAQNEAKMITEMLQELEKRSEELKELIENTKISFITEENFERRFEEINAKSDKFKAIISKCNEIEVTSHQFSCDEAILSHEIGSARKNLNLLELFNDLEKILKSLPLKLPHISNSYLKSHLDVCKVLNEEMNGLSTQYYTCLKKVQGLKFKC